MAKRQKPIEIQLQRAYVEPGLDDGYRVLVDHYWPRGRSKDSLKLDEWAKDLAPDTELIKWFGHRPERGEEFRRRYRGWLDESAQVARLKQLFDAAEGRRTTLIYGARSEDENQAVVIREALLELARR